MARPQGTNMPKSGYFLCKYLNIARRNPVPPFLGPAPRWPEQDEDEEKS